MNGRKSKQLKKTLLKKTAEIMLLVRDEYGDQTMQMSSDSLWKNFKRMYQNGKIPESLLVKK
jgi:hypothetical protein